MLINQHLWAFTIENISSIGFNSGQYGGRYIKRIAPAASTISSTPFFEVFCLQHIFDLAPVFQRVDSVIQ